jgi:hypothetical protein
MFTIASSRVFPCEMQPGKAGHSATNTPSWSGSIVTRNFTPQIYQSPERHATRLFAADPFDRLRAGSAVTTAALSSSIVSGLRSNKITTYDRRPLVPVGPSAITWRSTKKFAAGRCSCSSGASPPRRPWRERAGRRRRATLSSQRAVRPSVDRRLCISLWPL